MINNHQVEREKETPIRPSVFCYSLDFFFLSSYLSIKSINRRRRTNKEMIELWLMNQKKKNTEKSNERYLLWFSTESRLHSLYYSSMQGHCVFMFFIDFLSYCLFAWMLCLLNSPSLPKCYIREQMFAFFFVQHLLEYPLECLFRAKAKFKYPSPCPIFSILSSAWS